MGFILLIIVVVVPFFVINYFVTKLAVRHGYMEARRWTDNTGDNLLRYHIRQAVREVLEAEEEDEDEMEE